MREVGAVRHLGGEDGLQVGRLYSKFCSRLLALGILHQPIVLNLVLTFHNMRDYLTVDMDNMVNSSGTCRLEG